MTCDDGADNDGDGRVDSADPGCSDAGDTSEQDPALPCDDGVDNDADGSTDLADTECTDPSDPTEDPECDDGVDNDDDGLVDYPEDPGCTTPDTFEGNDALVCLDGLDNDGDGMIDYGWDWGCEDYFDLSEEPGLDIPCLDGVDNDGDGLIDFDDPGCGWELDASEHSPWLICDDGVDNDGDGLADYPNDPQCTSPAGSREAAAAARVRCGLGFELSVLLPALIALRRRRGARLR